ncbi:MAG: RagB/SusD family nutrient uptake outer membrane protein [Rikenellaceae bacterium]|nr:RagB/SusD family nutrient uptake outer membrane protein [Rikenellaceae bacterium]
MKRLPLYITTLFAAAAMCSCENFLDTNSPSTFTPEIVYDDASMTEKVLMGVYGKMTEDATYSQSLCYTFNCGSDIEIRSFTLGQPASSEDRAAAHLLAIPTNSKVTATVNALYEAIERANLLIEGIEAQSSPEDQQVWMMRAEAITMRAQCYRDLVRMLGNVPFKIEATKPDLSNVYLPKSDRFEIMETLIEQLLACANDLPWKQATPERITQGYCRGLAAQIALMRAGWNYTVDGVWEAPRADAADYYTIAREQTKKIMDEGGYYLTTASTDADGKQRSGFETLWRGMCERKYLANESLYEIGFVVARSSELGYTVGPRIQTATPKFGYTTQGQIFTTPEFFYSYHPEDTRRDVSVYYTEYRNISNTSSYANGVTGAYGLSENIITNAQQFRIGKWDPTWLPADFAAASYAAGGKVGTGVNVIMMRYSDVLLMFAEAENALNGATSEAKDALWQVRSRAIPTLSRAEFDSYIGSKDFQQAIEDERRWEFIGEGQRKWDLVRWGKLADAIIEMRAKNKALVVDWQYDFEFKTKTLSDGSVVNRTIPQEVYYKYDSNNLYIQDINIDYDRPQPESAEYFSTTNGKLWIYLGTNQKTKPGEAAEQYVQYLSEAASGIVDTNGELVANGRPFFPIPSSMITDYNGVLEQDYGF